MKPDRAGAEDVELLSFQFEQQPPVNRPHQFGGDHGTPVFRGQGHPGEAVEIFGAAGDAGGQPRETFGVFVPQNFVGRNVEFFQLGQRQINPAAFGVGAHVAQNIGELQRLAEMHGVVAAHGIWQPKISMLNRPTTEATRWQ